MQFNRAHKILLYTDKAQFDYCARSAGVARFAYNWALNEWNKQYALFKDGKIDTQPNEGELRKLFNRLKHVKAPPDYVRDPSQPLQYFNFVTEVSKYCPQESIRNLGKAFSRFFKHQAAYPQFKKRGVSDSFYLGNDVVKIIHDKDHNHFYIQLPLLSKPVRLAEKPRFDGKLMNAVISRVADKWFVSLNYETDLPIQISPNLSCGIDVGVSTLLTVYDSQGKMYKKDNPKTYNKYLKRMKRLSKEHSRKKKGSKNKEKSRIRLAKLHEKIANIRNDYLHKLTTELVKNYKEIKIEDLNVKGMLKNKKLARSIADASFYRLFSMLEYKRQVTGTVVKKVNRFYPSSKECSSCGKKNEELKLNQRKWECSCGASHDRDENAAKNILKYEESAFKKVKNKIVPEEIGELKLAERKGNAQPEG